MAAYVPPCAEHDDLIAAALRVIEATHYQRPENPHADAEHEYANEQLALAARALTRAVDAKPADDRPIGWDTDATPTEAEATVARVRAFAEDMATWCSPHGVAADYAKRLLAVIDNTKEN